MVSAVLTLYVCRPISGPVSLGYGPQADLDVAVNGLKGTPRKHERNQRHISQNGAETARWWHRALHGQCTVNPSLTPRYRSARLQSSQSISTIVTFVKTRSPVAQHCLRHVTWPFCPASFATTRRCSFLVYDLRRQPPVFVSSVRTR